MISQFKKDEIAFELRHEDAILNDPYRIVTVYIDGKPWKKMYQCEAKKAVNTLIMKGKSARYY